MGTLLAAMVPVVFLTVSSLPSDYHVPSRGQAQHATTPQFVNIICESKLVSRTGYETSPLIVRSFIQKAHRHAFWVISIRGDEALVMRDQGIGHRFLVAKRDASALILVSTEENQPTSVITIDPRKSSFVYSTRGVSQVGNRNNTFVGRCRLGEL
ncbi:MAG: hypothetical protein ACE5K9_01490 [Candidatus Methylomirabilales bacterium]